MEIKKDKPGERVLSFQIKDIDINNYKIELKSHTVPLELIGIANLFEETGTAESYFDICHKLIPEIPSDYTNKQPIYKYIIDIICGKLYYFTIITNHIKILASYPNIIKLIIIDDLNNISPVINNLYKNNDILNYHLNIFPKYIPTKITNDNFYIKNAQGEYVTLNKDFEIEFDSGNVSVNMIGKNIVNYSNLPVHDACTLYVAGITGETHCNQFVYLEFKFKDTYADSNQKSYNIIAFIKGDSGNTLLFGHKGGLDLLFKDNYAIKNLYDSDHSKYGSIEKSYNDIKIEY